MRIHLDRDHCAGNGVCESIAPKFFEIGDDGVLVLLRDTTTNDEEFSLVAEAVNACPALALSLRED